MLLNVTRPTHRANFSEHTQDKDGFQDEEDHNEDERHELVQSVERVCSVVGVRDSVLPEVGESEARVQCNITSTDEERSSRAEYEANGSNGPVVKDLVSHHGVHEQDPESSNDRSNVDGRECDADGAREREPANREDFADRDDDVAQEEELHFSATDGGSLHVRAQDEEQRGEDGEACT